MVRDDGVVGGCLWKNGVLEGWTVGGRHTTIVVQFYCNGDLVVVGALLPYMTTAGISFG